MARSKTYNVVLSYSLAKNGAALFDDVTAGSARARRRVEQDAAAAGKAIEGGLGKGAKAGNDVLGKSFDDAVNKARKSAKEIEVAFARAAAQQERDAAKAAQARVRAEQKAFDEQLRLSRQATRERERENARIVRDVERIAQQEERAAERAARAQARAASRSDRERRAQYADVASRTLSTAGSMASTALSTTRATAEAFGAKFSLTDAVGHAVENEAKALGIINQVKMAGKTAPEGGVKGLIGFANTAGDKTANSTGSILDALGEFQAKSNDLKTGQEVMVDLGKLAKAASAEFKDVAAGAAFINANLDDTPDRAEKLLAIMRGVTAQTAAGQIELEHWAKYMPRIAAAAQSFGGDYAKNIGILSALAQESVKGGRTTAAEASNSAAALPRDLRKATTKKWFDKFGIDIFTDKSATQIRPIMDLITESIVKTKGSQADLAKLWRNQSSSASVMALANAYNAAGGGAKGEAAIKKEMAQFDVGLSQKQVDDLSADSLGSKKSAAARFNNALDRIGADLADRVAPKLEAMAPAAVRAAEAMANFGVWAAEHPKTAIMTAIGAAFAKEAIGTVLKNALTGQGVGSGGSLGKVVGGLTAAGAALSVGTATFTITSAVISVLADASDKGDTKSQNQDAQIMNLLSAARAAEESGDPARIAAVMKELDDQRKLQEQRVERANEVSGGGAVTSFFSAIGGELFGGGGFEERGIARANADRLEGDGGLRQQLEQMNLKLESLRRAQDKVQQVQVVSMPPMPMMSSPEGREGIPGHGG